MKKYLLLDNNGFSLIELLMALVVFAVGIFAIAELQVSSMQFNTNARQMSMATMLAEGKMEELMSCSYDDTDLEDVDSDGTAGLGDPLDDDHASNTNYDGKEVNGNYVVYWNVAEDAPLNNSKTIRVVVAWDSKGTTKSVSLDCIRAK